MTSGPLYERLFRAGSRPDDSGRVHAREYRFMKALTVVLIAAATLLVPVTLYTALQPKPPDQVIRYLPAIEVDAPADWQNACV